MFNLMHLVMLYALIVLAVACLCNTIAIVVLSRRSKPRGMSYSDLKRSMDVQQSMQRAAGAGSRMSDHYRKTFGQ